MSHERTAAQLVAMVRDLIGRKDEGQYYDGYASQSASDAGLISILRAVNMAKRRIEFLGYARDTVTQAVTAASTGLTSNHEYTLDAKVIRVTAVVLVATSGGAVTPLREMNPDVIEHVRAQIPYQASGTPKEFYNFGNIVGLNPKPSAAHTATCYCHVTTDDLDETTDTPTKLPSVHHDALAYGAALILSAFDVENEAAQRRLPILERFYNEAVADLLANVRNRPDPIPLLSVPGLEPNRRSPARG